MIYRSSRPVPPIVAIYAVAFLDAVGIGLIFPILPHLLADVSRSADIAFRIGVMAALYAAMQFLFSPALGILSDTLGRRPVLLLSLLGAAINYGVLTVAPSFWMLLVGRIIAGVTGANTSVASAYITDISPPDQRAGRFGMFNAMFGAGFIVGPVLGGILGEHWIRLPFLVAAALTAGTLILTFLVLPETRAPHSSGQPSLHRLNPLGSLRGLTSLPGLLPILLASFIMAGSGEAYGVCWTLWGTETFGWSGLDAGVSLGVFGIFQTVAQATLPGRMSRWLGERRAAITGILCGACALTVLTFTRQSWSVFAIMPVFVLGGIGMPALLAFVTRAIPETQQGQFQGVLASTVSLASIAAPLGFSQFYSILHGNWTGAVWGLVALLNLSVIPLILLGTRHPGGPATSVRFLSARPD